MSWIGLHEHDDDEPPSDFVEVTTRRSDGTEVIYEIRRERTGPPFESCDRCGRPISEHRIFHDEPPPGHGLTEATFGGADTSGFYCPPEDDHG